jgi:methyl-accepting chemotaxis protein
MIRQLKLSGKFAVVIASILIGSAVVGIFGYFTLDLVKVNGPLYKNIVLGKDLVADILPPPEYVLESYLVCYQMADEKDGAAIDKYVKQLEKLESDYKDRHQYWDQNLPEGEIKSVLLKDSYDPATKFYSIIRNDLIPAVRRKDARAVASIMDGALKTEYGVHRAAIDHVVDLSNSWTAATEKEVNETILSRLSMVVGIGIISVSLVVALSIVIARMITKPVNTIVHAVENADLNTVFESDRKDEIGDMQRSLNKFIGAIKQTLEDVQNATVAVASASAQISSSTEEMASGSKEQASQASEVAAAVEEMARSIVENSNSAGTTAQTAEQARQAAAEGSKVVRETIEGMQQIAQVVRRSSDTIAQLGRSSDHIGEIVSVIDDIADQTNLLALNAAIEAARAGDQGRGFAVVADEVRKLAERTTRATKEIAGMIKEIQNSTHEAVSSMGEGTRVVDKGIAAADRADESLRDIVSLSEKVTGMIMQIAKASEQQSSASDEISKNVEGIRNVSTESEIATHQIAEAADDLNRLTENLQNAVHRFQIGGHTHSHENKTTSRDISMVRVRHDGALVAGR